VSPVAPTFPVLPVFPVFPVLPVAPGGPAGPGEQAPNASNISEATTNFEYFTIVPYHLYDENCSMVYQQSQILNPLTVEATSPTPQRLYADAHSASPRGHINLVLSTAAYGRPGAINAKIAYWLF
jgi:hypothetical protein